MPFDNTENVQDLSFATGWEGLRRLALLLRNEQQWRNRFEWDYGHVLAVDSACGTSGCAIGLAITQWPEFALAVRNQKRDDDPYYETAKECFNMQYDAIDKIFFGEAKSYQDTSMPEVTPGMVADTIDEYLEKGFVD